MFVHYKRWCLTFVFLFLLPVSSFATTDWQEVAAEDPSAAVKVVVVVEAKEVADLLGAAGLISPVLPVQAVRFSGVAPLSEAHLPAVPIILVVALEVLRAAV